MLKVQVENAFTLVELYGPNKWLKQQLLLYYIFEHYNYTFKYSFSIQMIF